MSRNHKHFWTSEKPFAQWKGGGTFSRYKEWNPEKGNLSQYLLQVGTQLGSILVTWHRIRNADLGVYWISFSRGEIHKSVLLMHATTWVALCYSHLPRSCLMSALAVLQALEHHITPRCQVAHAGPLSTHHSFGTESDALDHGASLSLSVTAQQLLETFLQQVCRRHPYIPHVKIPIRGDDKSHLFLAHEEELIVIVKIPLCLPF